MKVYIANPLYDVVFKRIMEEERIAKNVLVYDFAKRSRQYQDMPRWIPQYQKQ